MISIRNLSKKFGDIQALKDVSLSIRAGSFYGLLGPNGAGKTTTINILSSLLKPDSGGVTIAGMNLLKDSDACKQIMGIVPQELALYDSLTALENMRFWGSVFGMRGKALDRRIDELMELMSLDARKKHKIDTFSGGMKRRINLAVAMLHEPKVLLLDEPTVGIDIQSRYRIYDILKELHRQGITLIYTTHYMEEVERLCDWIAIIDHGEIKAEGTLSQLQDQVPRKDRVRFILSPDFRHSPPGPESPLPGEISLTEDGISGTGKVDELLPAMTGICTARGWSIQDVNVQTGSLESVFLELTGHEIRD